MGWRNPVVQRKSTLRGRIYSIKPLIQKVFTLFFDPLATVIISRYVIQVISAIVA